MVRNFRTSKTGRYAPRARGRHLSQLGHFQTVDVCPTGTRAASVGSGNLPNSDNWASQMRRAIVSKDVERVELFTRVREQVRCAGQGDLPASHKHGTNQHSEGEDKSNSTPNNRTQSGLLSRLKRVRPNLVLQVRADFYLDTFWTVLAVRSLFPSVSAGSSAPSGTRTHTESILSRLPLPIGLWGREEYFRPPHPIRVNEGYPPRLDQR